MKFDFGILLSYYMYNFEISFDEHGSCVFLQTVQKCTVGKKNTRTNSQQHKPGTEARYPTQEQEPGTEQLTSRTSTGYTEFSRVGHKLRTKNQKNPC